MPGAGAHLASQPPKEAPMGGPGSFPLESPSVCRLVAERVFFLGQRQVRRDRDRVRGTVEDVPSGQFAPREPHARGSETEAGREAVVEGLKPLLFARGREHEEGKAHGDKIPLLEFGEAREGR